MEIKHKVLAYITKDDHDERKILVFEQIDHPEAGLQVPGGTVEENEPLIDALYREIEEETGIRREQLQLNGKVNKMNYFPVHRKGVMHERNIFHLTYIGEVRNEWDVCVSGSGSDQGMVFRCRWVPVNNLPALAAAQDEAIALII